MDDKRKRSKHDLNLCLKTQGDQEEPSNKLLTLDEAMDFELKLKDRVYHVQIKKNKLELRRLKKLQKALKKEHNSYLFAIERQSSNSYDASESAAGMDMDQGIDQYLNDSVIDQPIMNK
ncbi:hypothetical protein RND71_003684 [Anisodus tanguticus]|uniref:Uncharacterized protein n=1 Tax=Anisodus tanguticus TaxID=243964 RepID=A0AAE1SX81_9SOLA|nr:hypothetical protein RND71_003684 [Anisodus tanguticus]